MNLNELKDIAYQCAVAHGWHKESLTDDHWLCLVISELMEAVEADRKYKYADVEVFNNIIKDNLQEDHYKFVLSYSKAFENYIKDSVEDELADACIRLLDYAGLKGYDLDNYDYEGSDTEDYSDMTFTEAVFCIVKYITDNFYKPDELLNEIFAFSASIKVNIMWHIQEKMKYNQLRSSNMETKHIEKKTVTRYKFDISLAKKIQNKEIEGKIVTRDGRNVRILCFDRNSIDCIVVLIDNKSWEMIESYTLDGALYDLGLESPLDLFIERSINC